MCPRSHWGSLQLSPDLLGGGEGDCCPLPKKPSPALGPSGLALSIRIFYSTVPSVGMGRKACIIFMCMKFSQIG